MSQTDLPLVPPARLAVLLSAKRRESGVELADLSRRSDNRFTPAMLDQIEKGRVQLDEEMLHHLVKIYGLEAAISLPTRSKLILDLDTQRLGVGDTMIPFEGSTTDVVLERYVSLLYLLRNEKPGRILPLRDDDLDVLGSTLNLPVHQLTTNLGAIMGAASTDRRTSRLSRHLSLGAAGLLVGMTAVGSLVIVGSPDVKDVAVGPVDQGEPAAAQLVTAVSSDNSRREASSQPSGAALLGVQSEATRQSITITQAAPSSPQPTLAEAPVKVQVEAPAQTESAAPAQTPVEAVTVAAEAPVATEVVSLAAIESYLGRDLQSAVPGWTIQLRGDLAGYRGQTNRAERTITVFLDEGSTVAGTAEILTHEIGHAIDLDHLDTDARLQWVEMRGMPKVWWAGDGLSDFAVGAGDFAEGVAAYLSGSPSVSDYGEFTSEQLAFVAEFVG